MAKIYPAEDRATVIEGIDGSGKTTLFSRRYPPPDRPRGRGELWTSQR